MKILMVNKFHYYKGGSEKYYFELAKLLKEHGHDIAFFSMKDEKNVITDCKEYFVKNINLNSNNKLKALDIIYSKENKKKMEEALADFKPDIVHLNNFQRQLSASIIEPIKKRNIPIVYTAHDLQAICPAILMLDNNNNICEKCLNGKYRYCIEKTCIKKSKLKSLLGVIEAKYYDNKKIYSDKINLIITPSKFLKSKLVEKGISKNKIRVIPNFSDEKNYKIEGEGYALYFGRLSAEKGILNLLQAFKNIKSHKLLIAGVGPEEENIKDIIKQNNMEKNVKLLGFLQENEIEEYIKKARFVVVPSICYENFPYGVLEAHLAGKPVIGANIGGIPEIISDGETGLLYQYNNIQELSEKMKILFEDNILLNKMNENIKNISKEKYNKENYYDSIIEVYNSLL